MIEVKEKEWSIEQKLHLIAATYGFEPQSRQLMEEMGECIAAINQNWRSEHRYLKEKRQQAREALIGELADIKVCLEQVIYLMGCEEQVTQQMEEKAERQIKRMKEAGLLS